MLFRSPFHNVFHTARKNAAFPVPSSTCADILFAECTSIRSEFENLKAQFVKDCNLFVSDDDIKLISKQLSKTDKALKDLEIKVQNTKLLMLR